MSIVSIFPHIKDVDNGHNVEISEIIGLIREGRWKDKIDPLRERERAGADDKELGDLKAKLPYFTGSGAFSKRRDSDLLQHSGRLVIDFDKVVSTYKDPAEVREALKADKYTEYLFTSCTGRGFAVIVKINPDQHKQVFNYLEKYYEKTYSFVDKSDQFVPLKLDVSCKDFSRPRYISYDPDLFCNEAAETAIVPTASIDSDEEKYDWCLNVQNKKHQYVVGDRHRYLVIFCFFLNKCGVSYEYTCDRIRRDFPFDDEKELSRLIRDCYKNQIDHGTFTINKKFEDMPPEFAENIKKVYGLAHTQNHAGRKYNNDDIENACRMSLLSMDTVKNIFKNVFEKHSDEFDLDNKPDIFSVELFIRKRFEVRKNIVTHRPEYRDRFGDDTEFKKLNPDQIFRELQHAKFKFTLDRLKSLLKTDYLPDFNPFSHYFETLEAWDGEDHIGKLAGYVKIDTDENQLFWATQFKKALVRQIQCGLDNIVNRVIITLVGINQNTGKSNFIKFLCPPALMEYYTETALEHSKDSDIQLSENWHWNMEELAALNNMEINRLKATISKSVVKQRGAYKEFAESNPRRVTFWASTNKTEFLTDDQNTRWLCFNVESINHNYSNFKTGVREIDINQVWAQAFHLYKEGFDANMTPEEQARQSVINKDYEVGSTEKDLVTEWFTPASPFEGEFMTATQILMELITKTDNKLRINPIGLGRALRQLGYDQMQVRIHKAPLKGYFVLRKTTPLLGATHNIDPGSIPPQKRPL